MVSDPHVEGVLARDSVNAELGKALAHNRGIGRGIALRRREKEKETFYFSVAGLAGLMIA